MMKNKLLKILSILLCLSLIFEQTGFAQVAGQLDISGHLASLRNAFAPDVFRPLHLRYLSYNSQANNFQLFLDKGSLKNPKTQELEDTTKALLNYFFVGISLPNDKFWVNLRPDAEDNIIDEQLAQTDVGRILLESDLQLKKDTARFTSPQTPEGKQYWDKLYQKAGEIFGSQNITIPTLTRPWIVPDEIIIRETTDSAYIYKATLKVMLEQDYLKGSAVYNFEDERLKELNEYSSQLIRGIIIPKLTQEINSSKRYASLRQVYYSLIMAQWFKARFHDKGDLYSRIIDRRVLTGMTSKEYWSKNTYFQAYQKSFKDGEYNIQEPIYTPYGQTIRSYFSGGISGIAPNMPPFGATTYTDPKTGARITSSPASGAISKIFRKGKKFLVPLLVSVAIATGTNLDTPLEVKVTTQEETPQITTPVDSKIATITTPKEIEEISQNDLIQIKLSPGTSYKVYRVEDTSIFYIEFNSVKLQNQALFRLSIFTESDTYAGKVLNDQQLNDVSEKREEVTGIGYDFRIGDICRFYTEAEKAGIALNELELRIKDDLLRFGFMEYRDRVYSSKQRIAIISCAQDSLPRGDTVFHELRHGYYFSDPFVRESVIAIWNSIDPKQQAKFIKAVHILAGYNSKDVDLIVNELYASLLDWSSPLAELCSYSDGPLPDVKLMQELYSKFEKIENEMHIRRVRKMMNDGIQNEVEKLLERIKNKSSSDQSKPFGQRDSRNKDTPSDSIGKFKELAPIEIDAQGRLTGIIENLDTGEIFNLSRLPQRGSSFDEVALYMHKVESLITTTEMSVPERELLEYILQLFRLNLPQNIVITQEVRAGFWGTGKPGLLVINQDILDNPIALLHEIIEYLKHKSPQMITLIMENLDEYGSRWLKGHIEKYGNNQKLDYLSENISHYIIRAFTRQVFGQKDIELSEKIKVSKYAKDFILEYKEGKFVSLSKKTESPKAQEGDPIFAQRYRSLTEDESRIKFLRESYPIPGVQIEVVRIPPGPFTPRGTGRAEKVGENHYKITLFGVDGSYGEYLLFHEFLHIYLAENGFIFALYHENEDVAHYLFELQNLINDYLIERENQRRFGDYYMGLTKELRDYNLQNQILFTAGSDRITNLRVFMLALTCKATVSLYPALSDSLSANTVGKVLTGGSLLEVISEVSKLSLSDPITKYRETVCKVHEFLTDDVAKFEGESFTFNVQEVSKFMDQIDALMNQLAQFKSMLGRRPSPEPPSISSTGIGYEREANRNILAGILDIAVKQGLITKTDKVQRLRDFEVNPESALSEDIDLQTDNQSVFLINGQKVIVIDSDYLSTTEEGEQYASAGLRRGVVYIARVKFQEWQRQGVLEQKIKHEQDEVAYLRKKALEIFPGVDEAIAYDLLSTFLKNSDNTKQARDLIGEAHNYAKAQEGESSSPGMQNGDTGKNNSVPQASLKDRISAWVREKLSYFQSGSRSSEITIEFPLEGDQFEIYQGSRKLGYLRYRIDNEFLKLDDLEIENEAENENIRQIIIQWVFGVASQFAGIRRFVVLAQAISNPNLVDALINSNLLSDIQIGGMIDGNYIAISAEEWRMRPRAKDISVTLRGTLNNNIAQPSTTIHELIPGLRSPSSSDIEFANGAAGFLVDFLGFDLVQKEEAVKNIVKNFRLKDSTRRGRGDFDKRWLKVAVLGSLSRNPGNGRQLGLGMLTSHFWAVFGHEATHFLQQVYRFGFSKYDTGWKNESIPYAVSIYLSALGYGTDVNMVAKKMKSKKDADILIDAFILGYQSDINSVTAETISRLMEERLYSTRDDEIWGATAGALIAGVAFRHYVSSGRWEDGRDVIRSFVISNNGDRAKPLDSPKQDSISPSQEEYSLSTEVNTGNLSPSEEFPSTQETARNFGGIDFRNLPIVTQAVGNLSANIGSASLNRFNNINLNSEWREIENLVNSGITPSSERIKEYVQASCYKGSVDRDIYKVISCISDILRIEEERYSPTDPTLKDILVVLDSANSAQQLKAVFIGTTP